MAGKQILYLDWRAGKEGWWTVATEHQGDPLSTWAHRITFQSQYVISVVGNEFFALGQNSLTGILFVNGKRIERHINLPSVGDFTTGTIGTRGKEFVYADSRARAKLMMIENPFK
jgi:hypothetical protein